MPKARHDARMPNSIVKAANIREIINMEKLKILTVEIAGCVIIDISINIVDNVINDIMGQKIVSAITGTKAKSNAINKAVY